MSYQIPKNGKFVQTNRGEIFGNLYRTQGVDLKTNPGKLLIGPRLTVNTKDNDGGITNMGVPGAFVIHNQGSGQHYYAMCGIGGTSGDLYTGSGAIFRSNTAAIDSVFINDPVVGSPTDVSAHLSDMVEWTTGVYASETPKPSLLVSISNGTLDIKRLHTTWDATWGTVTVGFSEALNDPTKALARQNPVNMCPSFNGNLYVGSGCKVTYVPPTTNSSAPAAVNSGPGTLDFNSRYQVLWIRSSSTALWIGLMTSGDIANPDVSIQGYVAKWDTTGTAPQQIIDINAPCALSCVIKDDIPYIIDAYGILKKYDGTNFKEVARLPVANRKIEMPGIYNGYSNQRWIRHRGMDLVDGLININVNNFVSTGVYVEDMPSGVWEYDENVGLYHKAPPCATSTDWGQQSILTVGGLFGSKRSTGTYLAGYAYYTDNATTSRNAIFHDDIVNTSNRRAIFITPWLNSEKILDVFQKVFYRFRIFMPGTKVISKSRIDKSGNLPLLAGATWVATNSLNSTDSNWQFASVGNEVEGIMGVAASTTARIDSIYLSPDDGVTYTINLNDTIGQTSGSCLMKINNYTYLGSVSQTLGSSQWVTVNKSDNSVQIKTEIRDEGGFELDDMTVTSAPQQLPQ